ncbi:uncharacterized protein LOC136039623 [Artemia franciscana]|uniref:uncharacterized protein LOC136039623 n=1 Tax=Artemia franciscana TaxID=6661 RepID=UPI0032DA9581
MIALICFSVTVLATMGMACDDIIHLCETATTGVDSDINTALQTEFDNLVEAKDFSEPLYNQIESDRKIVLNDRHYENESKKAEIESDRLSHRTFQKFKESLEASAKNSRNGEAGYTDYNSGYNSGYNGVYPGNSMQAYQNYGANYGQKSDTIILLLALIPITLTLGALAAFALNGSGFSGRSNKELNGLCMLLKIDCYMSKYILVLLIGNV